MMVYCKMDMLGAYLASVKDAVMSLLHFSLLANVAILLLILPHFNANEKHMFSLIRQTQTDIRSSLSLYGILGSVLTVKMVSEEPCYKFESPSEIINCSKKATLEYTKNIETKSNISNLLLWS